MNASVEEVGTVLEDVIDTDDDLIDGVPTVLEETRFVGDEVGAVVGIVGTAELDIILVVEIIGIVKLDITLKAAVVIELRTIKEEEEEVSLETEQSETGREINI